MVYDPNAALDTLKPKRRSLSNILSDQSFQQGDTGPSIEDDSAAYDTALKSADAETQRQNNVGVENVLGGLQSRGLARSGIALKDIVSQVLGPQQEKSDALAAQFGLEQAKNRSNLLEAARGRAADANTQARGGRLSAILNSDQENAALDEGAQSGAFGVLNAREGAAAAASEAATARANANAQAAKERKSDLYKGLIGGVAGGVAANLCFAPNVKVHMADGTKKRIDAIEVGDETRGGKVISTRKAFTDDMYLYDNVLVTGSHSVNEGGTWRHIKDTKDSKKMDGSFTIHSIITSGHRVWTDGFVADLEFGDEAEHDQGARMGGTMTDDETLAELNRLEAEKRGQVLAEASK